MTNFPKESGVAFRGENELFESNKLDGKSFRFYEKTKKTKWETNTAGAQDKNKSNRLFLKYEIRLICFFTVKCIGTMCHGDFCTLNKTD